MLKIITMLGLLSILLFKPVSSALKPIIYEEIRESMEYIDSSLKETDVIYVQYGSRWAFEFYKEKYIKTDVSIVMGTWVRNDLSRFDLELEGMKSFSRIWILFSHFVQYEKDYILSKCNEIGTEIKSFEYGGASAYLYEVADSPEIK